MAVQAINSCAEVVPTLKSEVDLSKILNIRGFFLDKVLTMDANFVDVSKSLFVGTRVLPEWQGHYDQTGFFLPLSDKSECLLATFQQQDTLWLCTLLQYVPWDKDKAYRLDYCCFCSPYCSRESSVALKQLVTSCTVRMLHTTYHCKHGP